MKIKSLLYVSLMSFVQPKSEFNRYKVDKISVATPWDKVIQTGGDFTYEVALPNAITDVVGMAIVEFTFPTDIIPTFFPTTTKLTGNNKLDFSLENTDIAPGPANFSVTFPTKFFAYENIANPSTSYTKNMEELINNAISQNATWKDKVYVTVVPSANFQTLLAISTIDILLPATSTTTMRLLFASGPNTLESAYYAMGFDTKTDVASSVTLFYLNNTTQTIESPSATRLRVAQYIDIFVEESDVRPLQRVFIEDPGYVTDYFSTEAVNRLTLNVNSPPRRIDKLHISLRYETYNDPGEFLGSPILVPHAMTFHIFSVVDENTAIPEYAHKKLSY